MEKVLMIWNWIRGLYTKPMEEDSTLVDKKLAELKKQTGHTWDHVKNFGAITKVDLSDVANPHFLPGTGYPIKTFVDLTTGEVKIYSAQSFFKKN
jgi:hypothetical protein